ncbi:hypothetical protein [Streptomyces sp. NPDC056480]
MSQHAAGLLAMELVWDRASLLGRLARAVPVSRSTSRPLVSR